VWAVRHARQWLPASDQRLTDNQLVGHPPRLIPSATTGAHLVHLLGPVPRIAASSAAAFAIAIGPTCPVFSYDPVFTASVSPPATMTAPLSIVPFDSEAPLAEGTWPLSNASPAATGSPYSGDGFGLYVAEGERVLTVAQAIAQGVRGHRLTLAAVDDQRPFWAAHPRDLGVPDLGATASRTPRVRAHRR